ncbi:putative Serine Carboxypeptidase S28 [Monocercomonoides exilis]|uniref:putative Serine Carboxypeptidase S28 n=1 Tax=Monocercomonoides exilis TaxID=2049356 RepID=UPI00355A55A1|nr:putative Serine Carboxypeptidase S28 [Monocercomonoides exilis]|eukprot:MONOS_6314.1-p1 / transcript=MONOS_6314.1 / gene=MONOS_6314 / organism=Monocercomonoides_exilis_PA203 / gene_product=Serine Carboxypeptidase S28 / transcript_product=Serine Carboxypeptidase S28 / location=Mono_scaffold00197:38842-40658(-) / protein_length=529 / sequence_SO=supercontig / SO=protein_coding / is_pseudo=false
MHIFLLYILFSSSQARFFGTQTFSLSSERSLTLQTKAPSTPNVRWLDQKLDHFDPKSNITFRQRYVTNDDFYTGTHLMFVYISGEAKMKDNCLEDNFLYTLAKEKGAFLASLEHRYYGESLPFTEHSVENLKYLNTNQALADLAYFIEFLKKENKDKQLYKVIIVGGSYAGCLSAWFRAMYPHLALGSISSSGPVLAEDEFIEYDQTISAALPDDCAGHVRNAMKEMEATIDNGKYVELQKASGCDKVEDNVDFLSGMGDMVAHAVQYNMDNEPDKAYKDLLCSTMSKPLVNGETESSHLLEFFNKMTEKMDTTCNEFVSLDPVIKNITANKLENGRQWTWQTCNEFGYFQTAPPQNSLRSTRVNLDYYHGICERAFGPGRIPDVSKINKYFKERNSLATNVIWTNGGFDPWSKLGITPGSFKDDGREARQNWKIRLIDKGSHCTDLHSPKSSDSESLKEARNAIRDAVNEWLTNASRDKEMTTKHPLFVSGVVLASISLVFMIIAIVLCCVCSSKKRKAMKVYQSLQ